VATSSIPAAIDYLVAQTRLLPECAAPVTVHDGWPVGTGNSAVAIGVVPHVDGSTPDEVVHGQLGAQMEREYYDIPCVISTWVGGGEEAVKASRDQAFTIYNAIISKVRQDRTLGGALHSGWAIVTGMHMDQTVTPQEAGEGRTCSISFVVRCENRF
jgi:hypothetical protein